MAECVEYKGKNLGSLELWGMRQKTDMPMFLSSDFAGNKIESPMIVSKQNYMEAGKTYLIKNKGSIREWECLKESNKAYKIKDMVDYSYGGMFGPSVIKGGTITWILKEEMYPMENPQYEIIETI